MLQRYQNILKKSAVNTDGLSLDTSIDSQDGSTHKFDDDSTQDTDFYSTFISNYREINKITIAREKERELNEKIRREMRTPKKIYRKRRNTMRDYMVFDPVFNKYFYNRFKSSSDDNDFEYYYYSDEEKSLPSKQNSKIKTVSKDINDDSIGDVVYSDEYDLFDEDGDMENVEKKDIKSLKKAFILHPKVSSPAVKSIKKKKRQSP